jgi:acyl-CoA thioesterase-1
LACGITSLPAVESDPSGSGRIIDSLARIDRDDSRRKYNRKTFSQESPLSFHDCPAFRVGRIGRRLWIGWSLAALLCASACGSAISPTGSSESPSKPISRIVVLGDSLAVSPSPEQNFTTELQARIAREGFPWSVTNASVSGDTSADGLRRIDPVVTGDIGVLIVELGANDGLQGMAVATIQQNLEAIIERARARGIRVLLCGMETPPTHGLDYSIAFHRIFPTLAQQHDIGLVPFLLADVVLRPDLNGPDGVHPNAAGAQQIAETVWPYLEPLLRP